MARTAALTTHTKRLTPTEVAQLWFRRGAAFAERILHEYPTFPKPGPDGLFLLSAVEEWFDTFHGNTKIAVLTPQQERAEAMRAALGQR